MPCWHKTGHFFVIFVTRHKFKKMFQSQSPIGEFILYVYKERAHVGNTHLKQRIENLIDLIKFRTLKKGFKYTSRSLQDELFEIRLELIDYLLYDPNLFSSIEERIAAEISRKYYFLDSNKELVTAVADSLEVYYKIYSKFSNEISEQINSISTIQKQDIPSLNSFKNMLKLFPSKELEYYLLWLESSLIYDYYIITAELIFNDAFKPHKSDILELSSLIKKSIVDFGTYAVFLGFWKPEIDDEIQLIRNIKIKAAVLEIENKRSSRYSLEGLKEFINNSL